MGRVEGEDIFSFCSTFATHISDESDVYWFIFYAYVRRLPEVYHWRDPMDGFLTLFATERLQGPARS